MSAPIPQTGGPTTHRRPRRAADARCPDQPAGRTNPLASATNLDAAALLKNQLGQLPAKDIDFARSLIRQFEQHGQPSEKQWFWVRTLAERAVPSQASGVPLPTTLLEVGDFVGVIGLFSRARKHLSQPRIWLALPDGRPLVLALAGPASSRAGWVNGTLSRLVLHARTPVSAFVGKLA